MASSDGHLVGPFWTGQQILEVASAAGWKGIDDLVIITAIAYAESSGGIGSYNDNLDNNGKILSRDCGLFQINIAADDIGTSIEKDLYIPENNAKAAFNLYSERGFEPWVTYNQGAYLEDHNMILALLGLINWTGGHFKGTQNSYANPLITNTQFLSLYPNTPIEAS